ncbi:hypothetical protein HDN1F_29960 [gamma proteobacterium HdN1]|nr:hypothetical protein HDN1F_29960 [gamma proteobacterium HdN1]
MRDRLSWPKIYYVPSSGQVLKATNIAPNKSQHLHASVRGRRCAPPVCSALGQKWHRATSGQGNERFLSLGRFFQGFSVSLCCHCGASISREVSAFSALRKNNHFQFWGGLYLQLVQWGAGVS